MNNKKGFTLVELLAVIVILSVILVIAIPNIMKIIEKTKLDLYYRNEGILTNATRNYLAGNPDKAPVNIGDIAVIDISELQSNNMIGTIKDVKSNNNCTGKVTIIKKSANEYTYIPYLECGASYRTYSYVTDGLVLYLDGYDAPINISGTNYWTDKSGNNHKARLINFTSDSGYNASTKGYTFDGVDDYMEITPFQQTYLQPNSYTVEMVYTLKDNISLNSNAYGLIGVNGSIGLPVQQTLGSKTANSTAGKIYVQATNGDSNTNYKSVQVELNLGEKTAVEYYSTTSEIGIYINAGNKSSMAYSYTPVLFRNYIWLGQVSASRYAKMDLYAIRIYNRVLSIEEITANYNLDKKLYGL
jgi:type IV pilus assembly protein PilA